jgi:hypothetical protein
LKLAAELLLRDELLEVRCWGCIGFCSSEDWLMDGQHQALGRCTFYIRCIGVLQFEDCLKEYERADVQRCVSVSHRFAKRGNVCCSMACSEHEFTSSELYQQRKTS